MFNGDSLFSFFLSLWRHARFIFSLGSFWIQLIKWTLPYSSFLTDVKVIISGAMIWKKKYRCYWSKVTGSKSSARSCILVSKIWFPFFVIVICCCFKLYLKFTIDSISVFQRSSVIWCEMWFVLNLFPFLCLIPPTLCIYLSSHNYY